MKTVKYIPSMVIGTVISFIILLTFWANYPYKVLEVKNATVEKTTLNRGEHIIYSYDYCKYINKEAKVYVKFSDGLEHNVPMFISNFPKGCGSKKLSIYIPKALPIANYTLTVTYKYQVNPIREIEIIGLYKEIEVIK